MKKSELAQSACQKVSNRRTFLQATATTTALQLFQAKMTIAEDSAVVSEIEESQVQKLVKRFVTSDLPEPKVMRSSRFVSVTTGRTDFVRQVLQIAEDTAFSYNRYMTSGRLPVKFSQNRMLLVVLANAGQYSKLLGEKKSRNEGGHFDLDENWTVTFDHRGRSRSTNANLARSNQVTLIHEVTHQLSFNTGLLKLNSDVPMLVSEGLATLAEPSGATVTAGFGQVNRPRVAVMTNILKRNPRALLPLKELITTDDPFFATDDPTLQMAYAQSWIFWDTVMNSPNYVGKMANYLKRLEGRITPQHRYDDFASAFGSPNEFEQSLFQNIQKYLS